MVSQGAGDDHVRVHSAENIFKSRTKFARCRVKVKVLAHVQVDKIDSFIQWEEGQSLFFIVAEKGDTVSPPCPFICHVAEHPLYSAGEINKTPIPAAQHYVERLVTSDGFGLDLSWFDTNAAIGTYCAFFHLFGPNVLENGCYLCVRQERFVGECLLPNVCRKRSFFDSFDDAL